MLQIKIVPQLILFHTTLASLYMETQNNTQPPLCFNLNNNHQQHDDDHQHHHDLFPCNENMFEKPLTPSDVGKLNRLVIPKQHAEKYFPLPGLQNGLVLSFEDESGKLWRFRYSYWSSSQSYVFTKGWNRYVKDKRLDAGDVVLFQRNMVDCQRMFIGCRRRFDVVPVQGMMAVAQPAGGDRAQVNEWSTRVVYDAPSSYPSHHHPSLPLPPPLPLQFQSDCFHAVDMYENVDTDTYQGGEVATRRLRLFGVNLEWQDTSEPSDPYGSSHGGQSDHQHNFT